MKKNMNNADKWIRIIVGVAVLSLLFILDGALRWLGLLGVILIATGLINFCPIYAMLRISTNKEKD